jgi:hypothetical protein
MKKYKIVLFTFLLLPLICLAQEKKKDSIIDKPERPAFESSTIINNQNNVLFTKNTLEVQMQHRFGLISEENSLLGIYGAFSNIRIGVSYALFDRLTLGYGITKENRLHDFNWKVGLLRQTRSDRIPVNITYYGNFTIDGRSGKNANLPFIMVQDRYSYFHQLIISRRFSPDFSFQIAPSISHYNAVESFMKNDRFSIAFGGRYKISPQTSLLLDYTQPLTQFDEDEFGNDYNHIGISIGIEFVTSAHAFQLFVTNFNGIVPQQNIMMNFNDFFSDGALIGFNITRNYNF